MRSFNGYVFSTGIINFLISSFGAWREIAKLVWEKSSVNFLIPGIIQQLETVILLFAKSNFF
jgi:hypothetical protein